MSTTIHKPEVIKRWADESGRKRGKIAEDAGISRYTLWRMEKGEPCPMETILALAAALNRPAREAFTDEALKKFSPLSLVV